MPNRPPTDTFARKIAFVIVLIGLVLGMIGIYRKDPGGIEVLPSAILSVLLLFVPKPELVADTSMPWTLRAAAFICGVSGFVAIFVVWLHSVGRTFGGLWTQFLRQDHVILYGDSKLLGSLAPVLRKAGHEPVPVRPYIPGAPLDPLVTEIRRGSEDLANRLGLNRARAVVVDCGDDAATLSLAKPVLAHLRRTPNARVRTIAVAVADPVISDQLFEIIRRHDLAARHGVVAFDTSTAVARRVLEIDPLFPRAMARKQARVHALIVGFGALGERLLDQIMLTSLAGDLGVPRITVVDRDAETRRRSFAARRPAVLDQFDISFVTLEVGGEPVDGLTSSAEATMLAEAEASEPFTAIFLALGRQSEVMRAALLIDRARERTGSFVAPIYYRCRLDGEAEDLLQAESLALTADRGFVRMSLDPAALVATILGSPKAEALASRLHAQYRKGPSVTPEANLPWEALPETYRRANIRTADHMPAKLWSIGIRIEGDVSRWKPTKTDRAILARLLAAPDDDPALQRLARIEHDRWMIDRRLDGWCLGSPRDNARRIHPLLIPYEELRKRPDEVAKDISQIRETLRFVDGLGDGAI